MLGGGFNFFWCSQPVWGNDPIWQAYFSNGLKPPTRMWCNKSFGLLKNHQIQSSSIIPNLYERKWLFHQTSIFNWLFGVPLGDIFPSQKSALSLDDFYGADAARGLFPSLQEAALIAFGGGVKHDGFVFMRFDHCLWLINLPPLIYLEDHPRTCRFTTVTTRIITCLVIAVNLHLTLELAGGQTQDICTNTCAMYILYISIAPETCKRRGSLWDLDWQKAYLFGRLPGTFLVANCQGKLVIGRNFCPPKMACNFSTLSNPHPSKLAILRTLSLLYRFKPFHWRVQWSLGEFVLFFCKSKINVAGYHWKKSRHR